MSDLQQLPEVQQVARLRDVGDQVISHRRNQDIDRPLADATAMDEPVPLNLCVAEFFEYSPDVRADEDLIVDAQVSVGRETVRDLTGRAEGGMEDGYGEAADEPIGQVGLGGGDGDVYSRPVACVLCRAARDQADRLRPARTHGPLPDDLEVLPGTAEPIGGHQRRVTGRGPTAQPMDRPQGRQVPSNSRL